MKHLRRFKGFQGKLAEFVRGDDHEGWVCTAADLEVERRQERERTLLQAWIELEMARQEELVRMQQKDFLNAVGESPLAPPPGTMHIFIRVPAGTTITLAVDGDETTVPV